MSLKRFRIHTAACQQPNGVKRWDRTFTKCRCPIHVEGTISIDGFVRACTKETVPDKAKVLADEWENRGTLAEPMPVPPGECAPDDQLTV
ncbi:MAG TPA: hypothetical protein VGF49_19785 [Candidatus Solibacter sp.]